MKLPQPGILNKHAPGQHNENAEECIGSYAQLYGGTLSGECADKAGECADKAGRRAMRIVRGSRIIEYLLLGT